MNITTSVIPVGYSIDRLKEEILSLVERGIIRRNSNCTFCVNTYPQENGLALNMS